MLKMAAETKLVIITHCSSIYVRVWPCVLRFPSHVLRFPSRVLHLPSHVLRFPSRVLRFPSRVLRLPFHVLRFPSRVLCLPPPPVFYVFPPVFYVPLRVLRFPSRVLRPSPCFTAPCIRVTISARFLMYKCPEIQKYKTLVYCRYRKRSLTFQAYALCERETRFSNISL